MSEQGGISDITVEALSGDQKPAVKKIERRRSPRFEGYKPKKYYAIVVLPFLVMLGGAVPFHHFIIEVVLTS